MVVVDRDGVIILANPQAARLFGYADGALVGAPIELLMPDEVHAAHRGHRERYMSTPRVRPMGAGQELTGRRRDGTRFPTEIGLSPIETSEGRFFAASIRDISDTQRARQAFARARHDAFLAQAGQLALESSVELTLGRMPQMLSAALGVEAVVVVQGYDARADLKVRAAFGVNPSELDPLLDALGAGEPRESSRPDAQAFALEWTAEQALAAGFRSGLSAHLFDVNRPSGVLLALSRTARSFDREAAHVLQSIANLLAAALQRHQTHEQLAHAQRLDAVGQLTGGIAHDFNNLLTVISGNLQLIEVELEDREDTRQVIASALRAVGRGADLTRKLLAFARRQRLSPRAVTPAQLLDDLGSMLRRTLGEQVDVEIDCAPDIPQVFADPAQLEAALINLALNARDAMPRGGRLRIAVRQQEVFEDTPSDELRPGQYVVFLVGDSGSGMAPEVLARAFEPFFTTKEPGKGSGLGLSMVYGFVMQSGGHLRTDSRPGQGTRIELFLPRARANPRVKSTAPQPLATRGHETVLVVEDEADVRGIALAFLRSLGYTVHAAANASEAQALLASHPQIDVLFSDVVLGAGPTGAELAVAARHLRPDLKILLTSGYERPADSREEQPGSEFELLRKPYRREELAQALRRALDGAKRQSLET